MIGLDACGNGRQLPDHPSVCMSTSDAELAIRCCISDSDAVSICRPNTIPNCPYSGSEGSTPLTPNLCPRAATYEEAFNECKAQGMRLCTAEELNQKGCNTGCGYDNTLVWSSDTCLPPSAPPPMLPLPPNFPPYYGCTHNYTRLDDRRMKTPVTVTYKGSPLLSASLLLDSDDESNVVNGEALLAMNASLLDRQQMQNSSGENATQVTTANVWTYDFVLTPASCLTVCCQTWQEVTNPHPALFDDGPCRSVSYSPSFFGHSVCRFSKFTQWNSNDDEQEPGWTLYQEPPPPPPPPPSPPPSPPPCVVDIGGDSCVWIRTVPSSAYNYQYAYDNLEGQEMHETTNLTQNGFCEESGGTRSWFVKTRDGNVDGGNGRGNSFTVPFTCDARTDMTDCCGVIDYTSRRQRRQLNYAYNTSASLPEELTLPLTPAMVKQILDDRSVISIHLPASVTGAFYTLAFAVEGQTASTPSPAAAAGCMDTVLMQATSGCDLVSQQQCASSYVQLVAGRIGAACAYSVSAGECQRGGWYRYC